MTETLATVEGVMSIAFELARIREEHGAQSGMYLSEVRALRAEVERLAAQAAPSEQADLRQLMGMNEAEIDAELIAAGISPDDAVKRADRAIKGALATIRAERRLDVIAADARALKGQP